MPVEKIVNEITEFKPFETNLQEFKSQYIDIVYDLTDPEQDKKARSDKHSIGKVISALDKKHKELKAPLKAKTDLIDGERKRIKDELLEIQGSIKMQLENHEKQKMAHDAKLFNMVKAIEDMAVFGEFENPTSEQLAELVVKAEAIDIDDSYDHRKADAALAKIEVIKKLELMRETALTREKEQAELEALRKAEAERKQKEREEEIRKEAAEKARLEAEQAAQKKIDEAKAAEQKAIDDAKRAEEAKKKEIEAAEKAERERVEAEQAENARIAAEKQAKEDAKKAKQAHRAKIHKAAKESLIENGIDSNEATEIVNLIKDSKITNVVIQY